MDTESSDEMAFSHGAFLWAHARVNLLLLPYI